MNLPLSRHPSFGRLRAFALGEADEAVRRRVARHLERCVRCREAIFRVREVVAAAREWRRPRRARSSGSSSGVGGANAWSCQPSRPGRTPAPGGCRASRRS